MAGSLRVKVDTNDFRLSSLARLSFWVTNVTFGAMTSFVGITGGAVTTRFTTRDVVTPEASVTATVIAYDPATAGARNDTVRCADVTPPGSVQRNAADSPSRG